MNNQIPFDKLTTIDGDKIQLTNSSGLVHLQLRRFSGCPICNTHLRNFSHSVPELQKLGVTEVVVFHSKDEIIKDTIRNVDWASQFKFVADPERELYIKMGADFSGWKYLFHMKMSTLLVGLKGTPRLLKLKRWGMEAGITQRPMDVLIDTSSGRILDLHYGIDSNDQWSHEEVLSKVKNAKPTLPQS